MVRITRLLHSTVLISDLPQAIEFYEGLLGLKAAPNRPELGFDGRWYCLGEQQIHLMQLPNPEKTKGIQLDRPEHAGRDRHLALQVDSIEKLAKQLAAAKIKYSLSRSGRKALFCRDPDDNGLEFIEMT